MLPPDIRVIERGWLSSNNILLSAGDEVTLVDSGYVATRRRRSRWSARRWPAVGWRG